MRFISFLRTLHIPYTVLFSILAPLAKWMYLVERRIVAILSLYAVATFLFSGTAIAQSDDQFVTSIDRMKQSVGPIACLQNGGFQIIGTGFFLDEHGSFLTAGHVVRAFLPAGSLHDSCITGVIYFPIDKWTRQAGQHVIAFVFRPERCEFDGLVDIAKCRTIDDTAIHPALHWHPLGVEWDNTDEPDGTAVAFTGFPLSAVIPLSARAHIATYLVPPRPGEIRFQMDKTAWGGASGSPVYVADGRVVGLVIQRGTGEAEGLSIAVGSQAISRFLSAYPAKNQSSGGQQ